MDFWSYMKQSDDYNMMTRLQLRIGIFLLVTVFPISFWGYDGIFMFMMLFFMCEIMIYQLKRKYYSTVQTYVRLNSWDHLGTWDQSGPPSSQTPCELEGILLSAANRIDCTTKDNTQILDTLL